VVSRLNEPVDWLDSEFHNTIIYNKCDRLNIENEINMTNLGRETETYLNYIITNYENLPDVVIFTRANIPDYVGPQNVEYLMKIKNEALINGKSKPTVTHFQPEGSRGSCWDKEWNVSVNGFFLHNSYKDNRRIPFIEWFRENVSNNYPNPINIYCHSVFAVKRDIIMKKTADYYKDLVKHVNHNIDPAEGHFFERAWYYIFS